jgi:hypothetical protein
MAKMLLGTASLLVQSVGASAQKGDPIPRVNVNACVGTVIALNAEKREVTLAPLSGDKTKTFTGILQKGLQIKQKDGSIGELKISEIEIGSAKMALYNVKTTTVDGQTVTTNEIYHFDPIILGPK